MITRIEFYGGLCDGEQQTVAPLDRELMKTAIISKKEDDGPTSIYKFQREESRGEITVWIFAVCQDETDPFA
jgi:hypothetical protein